MPNPTLSFRASPELEAAVDVLVRQDGTSRAAVLTELVELGLEARNGKPDPQDETAQTLAKILEAVEELRGRADREGIDEVDQTDALAGAVAALERLPTGLGEELGLIHSKTVGVLLAEIEQLRIAMRTAVVNFMRLGYPKLDQNEIKSMVDKAFDS